MVFDGIAVNRVMVAVSIMGWVMVDSAENSASFCVVETDLLYERRRIHSCEKPWPFVCIILTGSSGFVSISLR